jgi:hypothetical protein
MSPNSALITAPRFMPIMIACRIHGARSSGWPFLPNWMSTCSWYRPGIELYVMPFTCWSAVRAVCGDGAIASTSPPRMAWISEFVSVISLKSTSLRPGFVPYQNGLTFSVLPWPLV